VVVVGAKVVVVLVVLVVVVVGAKVVVVLVVEVVVVVGAAVVVVLVVEVVVVLVVVLVVVVVVGVKSSTTEFVQGEFIDVKRIQVVSSSTVQKPKEPTPAKNKLVQSNDCEYVTQSVEYSTLYAGPLKLLYSVNVIFLISVAIFYFNFILTIFILSPNYYGAIVVVVVVVEQQIPPV
jgi:hypothetical protein